MLLNVLSFEFCTAMTFQVEVFWVVTPCCVVEDGGSVVFQHVGTLPQYYTASQHRRPALWWPCCVFMVMKCKKMRWTGDVVRMRRTEFLWGRLL